MTASAISAPIVSVCMLCHRVIGPDQLPGATHIAGRALVSHGICLTCAPAYCAEQGLSAEETARILSPETRNTQHAT